MRVLIAEDEVSTAKAEVEDRVAGLEAGADDYLPKPTDKLFDRFYRPDESRSTSTGGYGVGLAIAKAVVETHGGTITAHCPDGKSMDIKVVL